MKHKIKKKKSVPHRQQVGMILLLQNMYFEEINICWEDHLEFIRWDKNHENYEPFTIFVLRLLWELIKEKGLVKDFPNYNMIMTFVYELPKENFEQLDKEIPLDLRLECLLDHYLELRKEIHYKRFDKYFNLNFYYLR